MVIYAFDCSAWRLPQTLLHGAHGGPRPPAPPTPPHLSCGYLLEGFLFSFRNQMHSLPWEFCNLGILLSCVLKPPSGVRTEGVEAMFGSFFIQTVYKE